MIMYLVIPAHLQGPAGPVGLRGEPGFEGLMVKA